MSLCVFGFMVFDSRKRSRPLLVTADLWPEDGGRPSLPQRSRWMWDSEVSLVQRSPSLVLTCAALPWLLQSSYTAPPTHQPIPRTPPPPPLLTALGPDYKISLVWSGLILEKPNPRLRVTPTGIITPQQTHLLEFVHKGVSWWADFKAIGDTSCVRLSK